MSDVRSLRDLRTGDRAVAGAKAANLGELIAAGVPVPEGFCLPIPVYDRVVGPALGPRVTRLARGEADERLELLAAELRATVMAVTLPDTLHTEIEEALGALSPAGGRVAVRSSGTFEDSAAASFAGQYRSELGVAVDDVLAAVRRCWASLWEPHVIRYRDRQGIGQTAVGMAVIIQTMAEAEAAGVLFTVDPHGGSGDQMVIESSWGYGEAVVSGLVTPDRFDVDRSGETIRRTAVSHKARMITSTPGAAVLDVPMERQDIPSLTDVQVRELARLGRTIEARFGGPQDVEWAIAEGRIAVLQARPITRRSGTEAVAPEVRWESPVEGAWWARISICDSWLPEPLSPLFATTLFPCLVRRWQRNWAGPESVQRKNPLLPQPMAGTINGFAYLRFDYHLNRHLLHTVALVLRWSRFHLAPLRRRWRTRILPHHLERIAAANRHDLAELEDAELLGLITEVQELSGEYWGIIGGLAWYWNVAEWLLAALYPRVVRPIAGDDIPAAPGTLVQGYPSKTFEAESELARLDPDDGRFAARFADFLSRYGHQVYNLDFVEPTPADDPSVFHATVEAYRSGATRDPGERLRELARRRDVRLAAIRSALRWSPLRRLLLTALLRWNRRQGRLRDEVLFHFTLGWPVLRRCHLELGRRLATAGAFVDAEDVFYLTEEELLAGLQAIGQGGVPEDHRETVARRRERRERHRRLIPPLQVPEDARMFLGKRDITALAIFNRDAVSDEGTGLRGSAVSPGRVTAPARRITSVRDFGKLQPGEVLVAPNLTPAWSPLLAIAGGVVTDTGGALSHGSIVAREYGIPAVMGTQEATSIIQDGQIVTIDGDRGLVY